MSESVNDIIKLSRLKKENERNLILTYWKNPDLFDNWYIDANTIIDKDVRALYELGRAMYKLGYVLDSIPSILEFLNFQPQYNFVDESEKRSYFNNLLDEIKTVSTFDFEVRFKQQSLLATKIEAHKMIRNLDEAIAIINKEDTSEQDIIDALTLRIEKISTSRFSEYVRHYDDFYTDEQFQQLFMPDNTITYEFDDIAPILNKSFNGFKIGRMSSIAGLSGVGKSQFTMYFAVYSQLKRGNKVLLITNELEPKDYYNMLYCIVAKEVFHFEFKREWFENHKILLKMCESNTDAYQILTKVHKYVKENYKDLLHIIDLSISSIAEVKKNIRIYSKQGYQLVIYDTAKPDDSTNQAWAQITEMMKELNNICKYCNVHLFLPWQIANAYEDVKRLTRQHLSESKDLPKMLANFATIRLLHEDEYINCEKQISCFREYKDEHDILVRQSFQLDKEKKYMVIYLDKLRFSGNTRKNLIYEFDTSTCTFKELGFCFIKKEKREYK